MLSQEGIRHQRIDGSTPREKRAQITRAWSASSNEVEEGEEEDGGEEVAQVLLVSIKAGGTGLSLTAANYAIIAEPFFNPYVLFLGLRSGQNGHRMCSCTSVKQMSKGTDDRFDSLMHMSLLLCPPPHK